MSNLENYICDGSSCHQLGHSQLDMDTFAWSGLVGGKDGQSFTKSDLAPVVIVFVSKGWCKYCVRISPVLSHIHKYNSEKLSIVVLNHSFVEVPYQEDGFEQFMRGKDLFNLNHSPKSPDELRELRKMLTDHCIEFPALLVFNRDTGKLITNDGYSILKSVYDLKKEYDYSSADVSDEFVRDIGLDFWVNAGSRHRKEPQAQTNCFKTASELR
ncbi:hypothetical protein HDU83_004619 [Entophlyctis luteolus]|nr:hypothetical protein HDU83_004619 [Entophlyctis luteolus]